MEIREKWNKMIDAEKCTFNGYTDFFKRESDKRRAEARQEAKDKLRK